MPSVAEMLTSRLDFCGDLGGDEVDSILSLEMSAIAPYDLYDTVNTALALSINLNDIGASPLLYFHMIRGLNHENHSQCYGS